jgi:DUF1009 family protein
MFNASISHKIGLVAGWGSFPVEVAAHLRSQGKEVFVVAIKNHADERLKPLATGLRWQGVLRLGGHMKFLAKQDVSQVVLAGKLFKDRILYHGRGWIEHFPDFTCFRILSRNFITKSRSGSDDSILGAIVSAYEQRGMQVLPVTDVAPQLLAEEGCLTKRRPSRAELLDIQFGWHIARQMGGLDIGQSVTVRDKVVLAVEAIEGTDALIKRTAALCPRGGFTLVKVAKPRQDMRFDVPTIGPRTVEQLARAGGSAIGIEAERTIIVERKKTLQAANRLGIKIIALRAVAADSAAVADFSGAPEMSPSRAASGRGAA